MSAVEVLVALAIAVGLVGVVVPVLPGSLLVLGAILVWSWDLGTNTAWVVFAVATAFIALGSIVKYVVPGRRLKEGGIPTSTLLLGGLLGVVGVYLAELRRVGSSAAWPATVHALKAVGLSLLIELVASLCAAATWATGVVLT
jgi:uncharacterized protein YqgC (DUF456 family)